MGELLDLLGSEEVIAFFTTNPVGLFLLAVLALVAVGVLILVGLWLLVAIMAKHAAKMIVSGEFWGILAVVVLALVVGFSWSLGPGQALLAGVGGLTAVGTARQLFVPALEKATAKKDGSTGEGQ